MGWVGKSPLASITTESIIIKLDLFYNNNQLGRIKVLAGKLDDWNNEILE
jgi:hypothetical protein